MHPIHFVTFDRAPLTPREAQLLEALLWIAGEMPRQVGLQGGLGFEAAARAGAEVAVGLIAHIFPDLSIRLIDAAPPPSAQN
jgi:hypothetical protein